MMNSKALGGNNMTFGCHQVQLHMLAVSLGTPNASSWRGQSRMSGESAPWQVFSNDSRTQVTERANREGGRLRTTKHSFPSDILKSPRPLLV